MSSTNLSTLREHYESAYASSVPEDVSWHLGREAQEAGGTVSDTILRALGDYFGLDVVLTGRRYREVEKKRATYQFQVPSSIKEALWKGSRQRGITESGFVIKILAQRYGLAYTPARRGRPRNAA